MFPKKYPRTRSFPDTVYFVTTHTKGFRRILNISWRAAIVANEIQRIQETCLAEIYAYSVLPHHFHLLLKSREELMVGQVVKQIKGRSAWRINNVLMVRGSIWESRFYSRIVFSERAFYDKLRYILFNPVKHGLVNVPEEYPFTYINELYYGAL
jgi:REP element-mobilizing transposase RayT